MSSELLEKILQVQDVEPASGLTVTLDDFAKAIVASVAATLKYSIAPDKAEEIARFVLGFFGHSEWIIDNCLKENDGRKWHKEHKDRNIFYLLEELGLLSQSIEELGVLELGLKASKNWRIHYWILNKQRISELAYAPKINEAPITPDKFAIYATESIWPARM